MLNEVRKMITLHQELSKHAEIGIQVLKSALCSKTRILILLVNDGKLGEKGIR